MNYNNATFERAYGTLEQLPISQKPEIAFSGRSNVGKSSLLNKLFNRKSLARVSSVPGKTITINFYSVDNCYFVDLPGYGYAKVSKSEKDRWSHMMEGYFNSNRNIALLVQLVDMRHTATEDDLMMIDFLNSSGIDYIVVLTKSDKLKKTQYKERLESAYKELSMVPKDKIFPFSAVNGENLQNIKAYIERKLED